MGLCISNKAGSVHNGSRRSSLALATTQEVKKIEDFKFSKSDFIFEKHGNFREQYQIGA